MGKFFVGVVAVAVFVYALFDLIATPRDQVRGLPKPLWFVAIIVPIVGPAMWLTLGHKRVWRPGSGGRPTRPPRGPQGPDDDPDYLRGL